MQEGIQVNKYISSSGFCSRREADELIAQGRVTINKNTVGLGARVKAGDVVAVDGEKIKPNVFYKLENGEFVEVPD